MLALTLDDSKHFPSRTQLVHFARQVMGCGPQAAATVLDQVAHGVAFAIGAATIYGKEHKQARGFTERLIAAMKRGMDRLAPAA